MINVLLPTDFSDNAKAASKMAIAQFDLASTNFVLCHAVVQPRSYSGMLVNITEIMLNDAHQNLEEAIRELKAFFGDDLKIVHRTQLGYMMDVMELCMRSERFDIIAMGTKGESNIASKVIGSNTEQIIRKSDIPILAIPFQMEDLVCKKVLIAVEKEELTKLDILKKILGSFKDKIDVTALTVLTNPEQRAAKSIDLNGRFIPVSVVTNNSPIDGIHQYLKTEPADLLVVYHANNTRLDYLFSRSVTKKLAGTMSLPLLVIPA